MKQEHKKILTHLGVILFFILVCAAYFSPVLSGKVMKQHDVQQWEGMSKEISDHRDQFHEEPLWTNSMFGGMPAYQISMLYPSNLIQYVNDLLLFAFPAPYGYIFIALLGFYILLLSMKLDWKVAVSGALGYAFSSYNFVIMMAGHNSKLHAIALMPFVIAGVVMVFDKRYLMGAVLAAMGLALEIYANHLQITYYLAIGLGLLVVVEFFKAVRQKDFGHFFKSSAVLTLAVIMSILPNITSLWATYEYGKESTRGPSELTAKKESKGLDIDYAFDWSYGISESFTMLVPDFMGGASSSELKKNSALYKALQERQSLGAIQQAPLYWGDQSYTAGPVYMGAIIVFLFLVGFMLVKNEYRWWLVAATVLFMVMAWGKNMLSVNEIFFHYIPGYNKFRTVSMALVFCSVSIVLLASLGLGKLFDSDLNKTDKQKALKLSYFIIGGLCLFFAVILPSMLDFSGKVDGQMVDGSGKPVQWIIDALRQDRESALRMDAFRSFFFVTAAFVCLWFWIAGTLRASYAVLAVAFLTMVDMWAVDKRYLNNDMFISKSRLSQEHTPSEADLAIMSDKTPGYRVFNATVSAFNDASTSYFHHSIGGYHGAKLKRYQELIEYQISKQNMKILDMLNTKYFIVQNPQSGQIMAQPNETACGSAWFVKEIKVVENADSEMAALTGFDPRTTAIVDRRFTREIAGLNIKPDSSASIKLVDYRPNRLQYESNASTEQLAILSEIYYGKGWNAFIDGKPVPHFRADYVLRAMRVPAGSHKIEFRFEPEVYFTGEKIAMAGSIILLLAFAGGIALEMKKRTGTSA